MIDDDEDDQEIFLTAMKELPIKAFCAAESRAEIALGKLRSRQITADLIFLDLNMPIMNGQEFLREIKKNEELKQIPVIVFSTSSHSDTIRETKELGAQDFITKPEKFDRLVTILQSIIV